MKKGLLIIGALAIAIATVPLFAAFEAHVINVTAHIENALTTHGDPIEFGTVFPQEYLLKGFDVQLSKSFQLQDPVRVDTVEYVIKQKPKCECIYDPIEDPVGFDIDCNGEQYVSVDYATHKCPEYYEKMLSLCPYLSKLPVEEEYGDYGVASYYVVDDPDYCVPRTGDEEAEGMLYLDGDYIDEWDVDLKVPPIDGYVGQDWPEDCPVLDQDPTCEDYGCDLWVEVTAIYKD